MTSKLYYTDPLIAAYMYEYFDVHYIDEFKLEFIWGKSTTGLYPVAPEKIFIADNFLHIFEPQVGDVIRSYDLDRRMAEDGVILIEHESDLQLAKKYLSADSHYIIQRQGKAFFWPEVSDDQ